MYLKVNINHHCLSSYHDGEEYGEWHDSYSTTFEGVEIVDKNEYSSTPISFDVKKGDTVYVLWCLYSTGDSFGRSENGSYEVLDVFKTFSKAEAAKENFERETKETEDWNKKCSCEYENEIGERIRGYRPWVGYFENLTGLYIDKAVISPNDEQYSSKRRK